MYVCNAMCFDSIKKKSPQTKVIDRFNLSKKWILVLFFYPSLSMVASDSEAIDCTLACIALSQYKIDML